MVMQTGQYLDSESILTFKEGLLGFEDIKKYRLIPIDNEIPFYFLREAESGGTQFIICDPFFFIPDYSIKYEKEIITELDAKDETDLRCFVIVNVSDSFENMTVNLKSPIIFNVNNMLARQFVLFDLDYPVRHRLLSAAGR